MRERQRDRLSSGVCVGVVRSGKCSDQQCQGCNCGHGDLPCGDDGNDLDQHRSNRHGSQFKLQLSAASLPLLQRSSEDYSASHSIRHRKICTIFLIPQRSGGIRFSCSFHSAPKGSLSFRSAAEESAFGFPQIPLPRRPTLNSLCSSARIEVFSPRTLPNSRYRPRKWRNSLCEPAL
jgi:hypothetical protein